jgi:hypothetical protein
MRFLSIAFLAVAGCHAVGGSVASNDLSTVPSASDLGSAPSDGGTADLAPAVKPSWTQQSVTGWHVGSFSDLWGSSPSDVWAVGSDYPDQTGYVYHSPGGGVWTQIKTAAPIYAVWGSGSNDVYVAGQNLLLHTADAGATWQTQTLPALGGGSWVLDTLWGSGAGDLYATGIRSDGSGTVVGSSILHSTGNGTWVTQYSSTDGYSFSLWGADANHLFALDRQTGAVLRSSGNGTWTAYGALGQSGSIWGLDAGRLYVSGTSGALFASTDAMHWTPQAIDQAGELLEDVWGTSSDDLFVVGSSGAIFHLSVGAWSQEVGVGPSKLFHVRAVGGDIYAVGDAGIFRRQ